MNKREERLKQEEKRNRRETLRWMNNMIHKMSQIQYEFATGIQNASEEYENEMFILFLLRLKYQKLKENL